MTRFFNQEFLLRCLVTISDILFTIWRFSMFNISWWCVKLISGHWAASWVRCFWATRCSHATTTWIFCETMCMCVELPARKRWVCTKVFRCVHRARSLPPTSDQLKNLPPIPKKIDQVNNSCPAKVLGRLFT